MSRLIRFTAALAASVALVGVPAAQAVENGPDPTVASAQAKLGPYSYSTVALTADQTPSSFAAATIYYPNDASQRWGAVSVAPGFTEGQWATSWLGPRLASNGFVVITFDSNNIFELPDARGKALVDALDYLVSSSSVRDRVDPSRLAVVGHSMGGGGTLEASKLRPSLKAAVALTPWDLTSNWSTDQVPTFIVGAELDWIAPRDWFSVPFYASLSGEKAYYVVKGGDHFTPTSDTPEVGSTTESWLKVFVDGDRRYQQFLCPGLSSVPAAKMLSYESTCPLA